MKARAQGAALAAGTLPPFVRVERTLLIGLNWQVSTRIVRVTPVGSAIVLEVPLLRGESVTTPDVRIAQGKVLVNMAPDATEVSFQSVLEQHSPVALVAPKASGWVEVWRLDLSPIWHATLEGIPVVHGEASARLPEWRPWPNETVLIHLLRPAGISGQTLTIDNSSYEVRPGLRATDATLAFSLRSSRGGEHVLHLPEGATLESVTVNGTRQPLRQQGRNVTLSIVPGLQNVQLTFRSPQGISAWFRAPPFDFGIQLATQLPNRECHDQHSLVGFALGAVRARSAARSGSVVLEPALGARAGRASASDKFPGCRSSATSGCCSPLGSRKSRCRPRRW